MHLHMIRSRPNKTSKMQIFRNTFYAVLISKNVFTLEPKGREKDTADGFKNGVHGPGFQPDGGFHIFSHSV